MQPGRAELSQASDDELRQMRDIAARGSLIMPIIGDLSDRAIALIDVRADENVLADVDGALS
jgi:hypothetical protein